MGTLIGYSLGSGVVMHVINAWSVHALAGGVDSL